MGDGTAIEWTDATWNPITGCSVVSPGCTNCYAMRLAGTRLKHEAKRIGLTRPSKAGPVWTGEVRFNEAELLKPLHWKRPRLIFVCAHGDLFHESVPDAWIDKVFAVMALAPQHTFQVLTKRSARMRAYLSNLDRLHAWYLAAQAHGASSVSVMGSGALPNVWLGVSAEDQQRADERIPDLYETPAAVRFLSAEPLLGPMRLVGTVQTGPGSWRSWDYLSGRAGLDLVIVGGENGDRPMHPDLPRQIRDDCARHSVAFFFKQWGSYAWVERVEGDPSTLTAYRAGKKAAGRLLDGVEHNAMPGRV